MNATLTLLDLAGTIALLLWGVQALPAQADRGYQHRIDKRAKRILRAH